jgi:hypothetical protein
VRRIAERPSSGSCGDLAVVYRVHLLRVATSSSVTQSCRPFKQFFSQPQEVLPQRGMTSAPSSAAQTWPPPATGVHDRHRCPHRGTLRSCRFAGKMGYGGGGRRLWVRRCARVPFLKPREVLPQRGMAFAHHPGRGLPRQSSRRAAQKGPSRLRSWPTKVASLQVKRLRPRSSGPGWTRLAGSRTN